MSRISAYLSGRRAQFRSPLSEILLSGHFADAICHFAALVDYIVLLEAARRDADSAAIFAALSARNARFPRKSEALAREARHSR